MAEKKEDLILDEKLSAVSGGANSPKSEEMSDSVGVIVFRECPLCGLICCHTVYSGGRVRCSNCGHTYIP